MLKGPFRKGRKSEREGHRYERNKMTMNAYLSIKTLNVNGLNAPNKRYRVAEWIRKHDPHICCLQQTYLRAKDQYRLKVKGWKKIFPESRQEKKLM